MLLNWAFSSLLKGVTCYIHHHGIKPELPLLNRKNQPFYVFVLIIGLTQKTLCWILNFIWAAVIVSSRKIFKFFYAVVPYTEVMFMGGEKSSYQGFSTTKF